MSYVLKYKPTGKYLNLGRRSTEPFNLGINPHVYKTIEDAKRAISSDVDDEIKRFKHFLAMGAIGLRTKGKPIWYDERHTKKLTKTQVKKLEWYENAVKTNEKYISFIDRFKKSDIEIEEWKE